ncbi:DNA cytosine methyltransferase [Nocardioides sp. R-C-SC26]|uniref:DNA cytosine methyltransferase n=1 Tax=Nocardioides sp. R-C-SC26 TaxID=2870414 RepID=UPI001E64C160|nr:DNA cytosine methyltransferase [Nocardioides sp. R-C-SC26]
MTLSVTDLFCGGGGSSTGMTQIPGVEIRMAANHWPLAVEVHNSNHPDADHAAADLHEEDPRFFPRTDILWASPECTKWSQASGGKYSSVSVETNLLDLLDPDLVEEDPETAIVQRSRLLMFDVLRFAEHHRYRAMVIENVVDIATNPKYAEAWTLWRKGLRNLGYEHRIVSLNSMHAQAHGDPAPQSRDRLYIVCWRRGDRAPNIDAVLRPLAWCPMCQGVVESRQAWKNGRTVGKYRSQYVYVHDGCGTTVEPGYLPAAAAIDWTLAGKRIGDRTKPLADKTRRRIAAGIARYWRPFHIEKGGNQYDAADPKHPSHGDPNAYYRAWAADDVLRTLHTVESKALVVPLEGRAGDRVKTDQDPLRTQTSRHLDALVGPPIVTRHYGIPGGDAARHSKPADEALRTITASGGNMSLLEPPFLLDRRFEYRTREVDEPLSTVTANDTSKALVQPFIAELRGGGSTARSVEQPAATFTASGTHHGLVCPAGGTWNDDAHPTSDPHRTMTTRETSALVMPYYSGSPSARPASEPLGTVTTVEKHALIHRLNGTTGNDAWATTPVSEELRTLTTKGTTAILTPGDIEAAAAQVDDCLFRMLEPHEIAAGMAFPADYQWAGTRRERVKLAGNAVTPPAARDLIAAVAEALVGAA